MEILLPVTAQILTITDTAQMGYVFLNSRILSSATTLPPHPQLFRRLKKNPEVVFCQFQSKESYENV